MNLLSIFIVLLTINLTPADMIDVLANTFLEQNHIAFNQSQYELYKLDRNPKWRGNVEGVGVYSYENYTVYFKDIVGTYQDIFIDTFSKTNFPDHFSFKNPKPSNDDLSYLPKLLNKPQEHKQYMGDDLYANADMYKYESKSYIIRFNVDKEEIIELEIYKK